MSAEPGRLSQLRREGGCFRLPNRAVIRVTGSDRLRYLNGQLSNDLRRLVPGHSLAALALTAKGKLCASVFVWITEDLVYVETDASLGETLVARLERYAVSDDVAFELCGHLEPQWHVFGPASAAYDGLSIRRLGVDGVDAVMPPSRLLEASENDREVLRIERGLPRWGAELTEDTLPHEAGLDQIAVDFRKGCYVGQETVSRIQSVGRVNRQLTGFIGDFVSQPFREAVLLDAAGGKAGNLTSALLHPELQKSVALGYLQTRSEGSSFSVVDESGACLGRAERSEFPLVSE